MRAKVDEDVFRELDRLAEESSDAGPARVTVLIEHVTPATAIPDAGDLPRATGDVLAGIVADLERLGAADVRPHVLATVVSARLTRSQIDRIAGREDIRRVHLSRPHRVIT
ncbi:hypothetical protein [Nonomuraea cavernae]|uniref:hypothetical protein n=1 Tax=Nonomuraea cavernae TaxID=2045107 RepID=UPI0034086EA2